ncbi:MAG: hypothetical protein ACYDCC_01790 [Actinomycetota bacterium]
MSIRLSRMIGLAIGAGLVACSFVPAHAAGPTVSISTANNAIVLSLPAAAGPTVTTASGVPTTIDGTASFDLTSTDTSVHLDFVNNLGYVVATADPSCVPDAVTGACSWSAPVPFILEPGAYTVVATAAEADLGSSAQSQISVTAV